MQIEINNKSVIFVQIKKSEIFPTLFSIILALFFDCNFF